MKKLIAVAIMALGFAASANAAPATAVYMHDPGCHWFKSGNKFVKTLVVKPGTSVFNYDEATLRFAGPHGVKLVPVNKALKVTKGVYHITMVGQAPDDNHLTLIVR